jgi:hypothetical protein
MVQAKIAFEWDGVALVAELTDRGCEIAGRPELAGFLNLAADPRSHDSAQGDPVALAVTRAADLLKGRVLTSSPSGRPAHMAR